MTNVISLYDKPNYIRSTKKIALDLFFDGIRDGRWQDEVNKVRVLPYKSEEQLAAKKEVTSVTISGSFKERLDNAIEQHSGYLGIDIDDVDPNEVKAFVCPDPYVAAAFMSISGHGVCLVFKVKPEKHKEAFEGICEYLWTRYKIPTDSTSINPSRARFVSHDPDIYVNDKPKLFAIYPKVKEPVSIPSAVYTADDFGYVMQQIVDGKVNLCENYYEWLRIGFAIAERFGEGGREFFHTVSSFSSKYEHKSCDKQYTNCLKARGKSKTNISTFYYYAKLAGLDIYTQRTKKIIRITDAGKKAGLKPDQIQQNLAEFEGITDTAEIVQQAFNGDVFIEEDTQLDQLEMFLRQSHDFRRNEVTRYIEDKGKVLKQKDLNTIFIKCKKVFGKLTYELMERLINSDFVVDYNPFFDFFREHENDEISTGHIDALFRSIVTKDSDYAVHFGRKWLVGMISSIHGQHSRLMPVLIGPQHKGKTEFFRRLLPAPLRPYYAESKLDAGKDDEILMTQKILIMDDEMGGKSKKESKRLKELTSKQTFSLREPYGRNNVDLVRLASLAGTTNEHGILNDPTGNTRVIPIEFYRLLFKEYNEIDKTKVFMEAYRLYKEGFQWELTEDDIKWLGLDSISYEIENLEQELILKYYEPATIAESTENTAGIEKLTASEIKVYIESKTNQRLELQKIGKELKRLGYQQAHVKTGGGSTKRCYLMRRLNWNEGGDFGTSFPEDFGNMSDPPW
jgi:predicted P-loop ATPase